MRTLPQILRSRMAGAPSRSPVQRLQVAFLMVITLTVLATVFYHLQEGMPWLEALYMTVITLSTVGFQEVEPLSPQGRVFTLLLITLGLGLALYAVGTAAEFLVEGRLMDVLGRRSMEKALAKMKDHVVLCGYGRLGRVVAQELQRAEVDVVIVEFDPDIEPVLLQAGFPYLIGSALETEILERAGVTRARAIAISTPSDADNVFIALSAREMNPQITVHARAETETGERHLKLAGADQIISPYHLSGQRIANALVRPTVMDFIEIASPGGEADFVLEEVRLEPGCPLHNTALGDLSQHQVHIAVVGIQRDQEPMEVMPGPEARLQSGDRIVVVGQEAQLTRLSRLAQAG